jgi:hypothetical protein
MKRTHFETRGSGEQVSPASALTKREPIQKAITEVKQSVLHEFGEQAGDHSRLLRLALNEAEAVAWQSGFPHLFFPVLAAEKAKAAVSWHRRQHALRRSESERAFAE